jgi:hypothetical protein
MVGLERDAVSRVPAVLVYDTAAQPLRPGVRAVTQRARRLLFMAEDTELMLQLAPTPIPSRLKLVGQVLDCGEPVSGAAVELQGPAGSIAQATDIDGHFCIDELPKGAYAIAVAAHHQSLSVADLALD